MKKYLKLLIPPILIDLYRRFKKNPIQEEINPEENALLKEKYLQLNTNIKGNQQVIREGILLSIHPECRWANEYFCYRSKVSADELDFFIQKTKDKKTLLDVGALHGIFSLVFAINNPEKKAIAADPSPLAFARLLYNIYANNLQNIRPVNCALSDVPGILTMHYEGEHLISADTHRSGENYIEVVKKTGDALCASFSFEPDVIKIDVEGHEVKVVRGLTNIIEKVKPLVFLELHPYLIEQDGDDINELFSLFSRNNYQAFLPNGSPISLDEILPQSAWRILLSAEERVQ